MPYKFTVKYGTIKTHTKHVHKHPYSNLITGVQCRVGITDVHLQCGNIVIHSIIINVDVSILPVEATSGRVYAHAGQLTISSWASLIALISSTAPSGTTVVSGFSDEISGTN